MYRPVPSAPRESGSCVRMRALDPSEAHSSVPWEGVAWKESEQVGPRGWGMVLLPFRRGGYRGGGPRDLRPREGSAEREIIFF